MENKKANRSVEDESTPIIRANGELVKMPEIVDAFDEKDNVAIGIVVQKWCH